MMGSCRPFIILSQAKVLTDDSKSVAKAVVSDQMLQFANIGHRRDLRLKKLNLDHDYAAQRLLEQRANPSRVRTVWTQNE